MDSGSRGVKLFRIFGVQVHIELSWLILLALVVWTMGRVFFGPLYGSEPRLVWSLAILASLLLFASILFHKLSHAVASNRLGVRVDRITLFVFGGIAHMEDEPKEPRTDLLIAAAGPASSLVLWSVFEGAASLAEIAGALPAMSLFTTLARLNLALALFNLVPGFPLDGGRILRALVWWSTGNVRRATDIAAKGGTALGYLLMFTGLLQIVEGSFLGGVWTILIGTFIRAAAKHSYRRVLMEDVLQGIAVSDVMGRNVLAVGERESLELIIEQKFLHHKFTDYPVVDLAGNVVGVVDFDQVRDVPREERLRRSAIDVMRTLSAATLPRPGSRALDALATMTTLGLHRLPVVDEAGQLAGIVSEGDIISTFRIRSDLEEKAAA